MTQKIRNAVLDHIRDHPDCTSDDAAVALGLDPDGADVTACYLMQDGLIYQTGKRESAIGPSLARGPRLDPIGETKRGLRPTYRVKNHGGQ